ncbi:MAG: hypothetical protein HQK84_03065 [Nitrospinae bacterium]|nr:hypothetical protein [Nitrospinota bacterium]
MILGKDIQPERKLYYLGAIVLEIIRNAPEKKLRFFDIFQELKQQENISMNLFSLTLDWLFLLGAINNNEDGIEICS